MSTITVWGRYVSLEAEHFRTDGITVEALQLNMENNILGGKLVKPNQKKCYLGILGETISFLMYT